MSEPSFPSAVEPPPHVPPGLVVDFDYFHPEGLEETGDVYAALKPLHDRPDIFWTPRNGGHWMLTSHAANFNASRDTESFSSEFTPPERIAETFSADTISKLMHESAPATPAKNDESTSCRKRTRCVL